jgi:hypothetical protein
MTDSSNLFARILLCSFLSFSHSIQIFYFASIRLEIIRDQIFYFASIRLEVIRDSKQNKTQQ